MGMVQTAFSSLKSVASAAAGTVISVLPGITNAVAAVVTGVTPLIETVSNIFVAGSAYCSKCNKQSEWCCSEVSSSSIHSG